MKKILLTLLFYYSCSTVFFAQTPANHLDQWSSLSPIEKIYLHFDRDNYLAGESAWFKAYLYSDFQPDTISTTLYVELMSDSVTVLSRLTLPVYLGCSNGQFDLPDTLVSGQYIIRAYTATLLNQPPGQTAGDVPFLYLHPLLVFGKKSTTPVAPREKKLRIEFFPEGGNFVTGLTNSVAFKITNEYGLPVSADGYVENEKGERVAELKSYHDGMGVFDIMPEPASRYFAKLDIDSTGNSYPLPVQTPSGVVFRIVRDDRGSFYELFSKAGAEGRTPARIVGQIQHHVVFRKELAAGKTDWSGVIDTRTSMSGILQVTVFDKEDVPMAERLVFIDNKEYLKTATLHIDTLNTGGRGKNQFSISFNDTISGNFSVAITDADYALEKTSQQTIVSGLLLTADLKGYIHNPAYYFSSDNDSVRNALDLVMMVNGWRRFTWSALSQNSFRPLPFRDNGYITVAGRVMVRDTKKPLSDYELVVLQTSADSLQNSFDMITTDKDGYFKMDSLIFFGETRFFVTDIKGKKSKWLDIIPAGDSLPKIFSLPPADERLFYKRNYTTSGSFGSKLSFDYDAIAGENGKTLEAVNIKVKKKSALQELDEKYATGLFSGMSQKTIDLVNTNERLYHRNIFEYIQGRVAGISVVKNGIDYILYYRQNFSMTSGRIPMKLFLDEMQVDASIIATIPADQVAMLKVYSTFVGAEGNGAGGVLAVYTKKGADVKTMQGSADVFSWKGYSVTREFYTPDYSVAIADTKPDHRITLHWLPVTFVEQADAKLPLIFYNNDRTKRFRIIAEGITWDGKLLHLEKIISAGERP